MDFLQTLQTTLKTDARFISQEGILLKPKIVDAATSLDPKLIRLLLNEPTLKSYFFTEIDDICVFDKAKFQWIINSKEFLPDSYTKYRNKIGLSSNDHDLISASSEVTLVWPYKDCLLEGGQNKEDEKREEIFYNETLAPDEIGRLLAPKAFKNAVRYTAEGKQQIDAFSEDDNLIIKGNNLLALTSLLERYQGKIKCIYIDPPYNTGNDDFKYNDKFNHSTWLTFMRNRLTLASKLLTNDGLLFVQCDDNEQAYLKVLMDEIFPGGFVNCIAVKMSESSGVKMSHSSTRLPKLKEYILLYKKNQINLNEMKVRKNQWDSEYATMMTNITEDELLSIKKIIANPNRSFAEIEQVQNLLNKANYKRLSQIYKERGLTSDLDIEEFNFKNSYRIFQTASMGGGTTEAINRSRIEKCKNIFFTHITPTKRMYIIKGDYSLKQRKPRIQVLFADQYLEINPGDFWSDIRTTGLDNEGIYFKNGKKPEALIRRILQLGSKSGDLVLDFHLGSGTTAAVAQKMGRKYIGVEQMNYIETTALLRMKRVLEGEQSGISPQENWHGGGSFVYVELAERGEQLMEQLATANDATGVQQVLDEATKRGLLRPSVLPSELKQTTADFGALPLDKQKQVVAELIDKNRLYVNAADMNDADTGLSEADKSFTHSFYNQETKA